MSSTFLKTIEQFKKYDESLKVKYKGLCIGKNEIVDFVRLKSNRKKENTCAFIVLRNVISNEIQIKRFDNYRKTCKRLFENSLYNKGIASKSYIEFNKLFKNVEIAGLKVIETKFNYRTIVDEKFNYIKYHNPIDRRILMESISNKKRQWFDLRSIKEFERHLQINPNFKIKLKY